MTAKEFAEFHHRNQLYGGNPYPYHLEWVYDTLVFFEQTDSAILDASWLHDVVEDTDVTIEDIEKEFGAEVAEYVWAVTGIGNNRLERNSNVYVG